MISRFFLQRPVFACVIAILMVFVGLAALKALPIEQYPEMSPPQILVKTSYRGADAETIAQTVAAILEQEINGVENMLYMYSQNSSSGDMTLTVVFEIGTDVNRAQIDVQNKVNTVLAKLPQEVQREGVTVDKQTPTILLIAAIQCPEGTYDNIFISNYASINIVDELKRIPGISDVNIIGAREYSMRIWLRPDKMAQLGITTGDVINAIQEQNAQFPVGSIGQPPMKTPPVLTLPVVTQGRFTDPKEFEEMILKAKSDGSITRLKDIATVDLGAQSYDVIGELNGQQTTLIAIYQQFGANALGVADRVKSTMERLSKTFPKGIVYSIPYDITTFVKVSIEEVFKTFYEAAVLVALVVLVFLQTWRATMIPVIAMLVSIIGTFAGMYLLGFSVNTLTMFGLVLAIGMVVDDAIVVLENVERNMKETPDAPIEAAGRAMEEVTAPVIATSLVLCAVFIPVAFLGGIAGQLYKQFAITISVSVILSTILALTLSPVMAAFLIRVHGEEGRFAKVFNAFFDKITATYMKGTDFFLHRPWVGVFLFGGMVLVMTTLFLSVPTSLVPDEDQGYLFAVANLPDNASVDRTANLDHTVLKISKDNNAVVDVISLSGYSLLEGMMRTTTGSNFVILKDWSERKDPSSQASGVLRYLSRQFWKVQEGAVVTFIPPAIQGMGAVGGFEMWMEDRAGLGIDNLNGIVQKFLDEARKNPAIGSVSTTLSTSSTQVYLALDRAKAKSLGVSIDDVFKTLQGLLGTVYVNDFNKFGRVFRVIVQATPSFREKIQDIGEVFVRSQDGTMVPVKSLVDVRFEKGPAVVSRFNNFPAAKILGNPAVGYTSGQALQALEAAASKTLPQGVTYSWGGLSFQEKKTGGTSSQVLLGGLFIVFLILAALYERWALPTAILLAVPFGVVGALIAIWLSGRANDVYFQIGLVALVGLAAKNAILIVEFAHQKRLGGMGIIEAAKDATRLRFRAIVMTSLTTIIGVLPLVFSAGAGAASRQSLGLGMFGGMTAATFLAVLFVPLFYRIIAELSEGKKKP